MKRMWRRAGNGPWVAGRTIAVVVVAATLGLVGVSCSETSPTREIARNSSESTIPGVPPTAPPTTKYDGRGLSPDAMALIGELNDLLSERDICEVLTGNALKPFLSGDFDATSLVTSPSGVSQLLVAVDSLFTHLVDIAPDEIKPAMDTIRSTWKRVAAIDPGATDREARTDAILAEPESRAATQILGAWLPQNCGPAASILSGIPGLAPK
ncbi:MAG: hypothetical protein WBF71_06110 [Microthrixaceae bacterium]